MDGRTKRDAPHQVGDIVTAHHDSIGFDARDCCIPHRVLVSLAHQTLTFHSFQDLNNRSRQFTKCIDDNGAAIPPDLLITTRPVGVPGLNHSRALSARPPIMPTTALPGLKTPSVFGPTNIAPLAFAAAAISIASHTGTRSGTSTVSLIPDSIAAIAASFTPAAGTNKTEMSI